MAEHFLQVFARLEQKSFQGFNGSAKLFLRQYHWPGNVRQLENLIHNIVVMTDHKIIDSGPLQSALEGDVSRPKMNASMTEKMVSQPSDASPMTQVRPLWQVEKSSIEDAISLCGGNVPRAAALLEVSPSTIYRKQKHW